MYYTVSYQGKEIMKVWASSTKEAKDKAIRTLASEGRRGINLAGLEVNRSVKQGTQQF